MNEQTNTRDGRLKSIWQTPEGKPIQTIQSQQPADAFCDVLIVGAGITGLTTALLLQDAGKKCIIAEAYHPGFGTTGGTTAHINTMLDSSYNIIEKDFGTTGAELVAKATHIARDLIGKNVEQYHIDCDFAYKDGYLFAQTEDEEHELMDVLRASKAAGVSVEEVHSIPVPLPFLKSICYKKQAQIHPLKYLHGLLAAFVERGGILLENSKVENVLSKDGLHMATCGGQQTVAEQLVYATHIPPGLNMLHLECAPYRSYVLGIKLTDDHQYPVQLAYDMKEPYHYFRTHIIDGQKYLIFGGSDHKTGHGDPGQSFKDLEDFIHSYFNVASIDYRWSAQYYEPADGLPYIGKLPGAEEGIYTATGYSGNGIVFGSFSGTLLCDLILGRETPFEKLFAPSRIKPIAGFSEFIKENADVAYQFFAGRVNLEHLSSLTSLAPDTGMVIGHQHEKMAVYKTSNGRIRALNAVCTHAKCIVVWNNEEKSWDCPCHGGRFDTYGKAITGPPQKDLQRIDLHST